MNEAQKKIFFSIFICLLYLGIKYYFPLGYFLLYPIALFVTFLHEIGHAVAAIITGGSVVAVQVNANGSGVAYTSGGIETVILMGGYIGSAVFGNIILRIGMIRQKYARVTIYVITGFAIFSSVFWYSSLSSFLILALYALFFIWIGSKDKKYLSYMLISIGVLSITYIVEDFNIGPASDIQKFSSQIGGGQFLWMVIWLIIVLLLTLMNIRFILKKL